MFKKTILPLAVGKLLLAGAVWAEGFSFVLETQWKVSSDAVRVVAFSPDGTWFTVVAGKQAVALEIDDRGTVSQRGLLLGARKDVLDCAVSPDGRVVAAVDAGGALHLFDATTLRLTKSVSKAHAGKATAVAFTADGQYVLTGGQKGTVKAWTTTGVLFAELTASRLTRHGDAVIMVAGVPPGRSALSVGEDRQILLWQVDTQQVVRPSMVEMDVLSAAVGGGGRVLALGLQHLSGNISAVRQFVSARETETIDRVRLIDAETGAQMRELEGGDQDVDAVGVTPDGRFVAAGGSRATAVWDAATGRMVTGIPSSEAVTALAFSPEGRWLLTGTRGGQLALYRLTGVGPAPLLQPAPGQIIVIIIEPENVIIERGSPGGPVPRVSTNSLRVRGRIKTSTPLKTLQVNGREITSLEPGDAAEGDYLFTGWVALPRAGRQQVDILVEDQAGSTTHRSFVVERTGELRPPDPAAGRRLALIVGISRYADPSINLDYADDDARALYELLTSEALGPAAFDPRDVRLLLDQEATVAEVNTGLREFLQRATENDFALFFFAGHGAPDPNRIRDIYLLAHDTDPDNIAGTGLLMRHVREAIAAIRARHVVILTDACHSAGMAAPKSLRAIKVNPIHETFLDKMRHASGGLAILTASEAAQTAEESDQWQKHGVFTYHLLAGLRGRADENRDKIVTLGEIMEYVREQVKKDTDARQIPAIGPTSFDRQMPLIIVESH